MCDGADLARVCSDDTRNTQGHNRSCMEKKPGKKNDHNRGGAEAPSHPAVTTAVNTSTERAKRSVRQKGGNYDVEIPD